MKTDRNTRLYTAAKSRTGCGVAVLAGVGVDWGVEVGCGVAVGTAVAVGSGVGKV
jgi:hypothetical protein